MRGKTKSATGATLKAPAHTTPEEFENATITGHFGFVFEETSVRESRDHYRDASVFEKLRFPSVFSPHENEKSAFSNSSGWKSVFEKD